MSPFAGRLSPSPRRDEAYYGLCKGVPSLYDATFREPSHRFRIYLKGSLKIIMEPPYDFTRDLCTSWPSLYVFLQLGLNAGV